MKLIIATLLAWPGLALAQEAWEVGGQIDAEGVYRQSDADVGVAEAVLRGEAGINGWIGGEVGLLYEDGTRTVVEIATLTLGAPQGLWSVTAGRQYAPFGVFATHLISDPLTLELGETNELAVQLGVGYSGWHGTIFGFYGDDEQNGGYGAALGYRLAHSALNLSYISAISASENLQEGDVPGWAVSAELGYKDVSLIGEYLAARGGARPASWLLEAACDVRIANKAATVAASYQGTKEVLVLELPARRAIAGLAVKLAEWFTPAIEWARDEDSSGEQVRAITVQVSAKF